MRKIAMTDAASIPPITVVPKMCRDAAPDPDETTSGATPENKSEGRHEDGAETDPRGGESRLDERPALLKLHLGEFDDQESHSWPPGRSA